MAGSLLSCCGASLAWRHAALPLLLLTACTSTEPPPRTEPAAEPRSSVLPADLVITLERTQCYGSCPAYEVSVDAKGVVRWNGKAFVEHEGPAQAQLDSLAPLEELWRQLEAVDYSALPSSRARIRDAPFCPSYSTDAPGVDVHIEANGGDRRVYDYHGCREYPPMAAFRELEDRIDAVLGTARWIGETFTLE